MANMKFRKLYDFRTTLYSGVFGVADYEFQNFSFSTFLKKTSGLKNMLAQGSRLSPTELHQADR